MTNSEDNASNQVAVIAEEYGLRTVLNGIVQEYSTEEVIQALVAVKDVKEPIENTAAVDCTISELRILRQAVYNSGRTLRESVRGADIGIDLHKMHEIIYKTLDHLTDKIDKAQEEIDD